MTVTIDTTSPPGAWAEAIKSLPRRPRLVALCSPAMGSGKSTVAQHLVGRHGFKRIAFAGPLKHMAEAMLLSTAMSYQEAWERVYGSRKEEIVPALGITSRRLQQILGTEFGRDLIHPDIWVNITMSAAASYMADGHSVVVDDMRFPNEYRAVEAAGGECYRVIRPGATLTTDPHPSEGQLDGIHMPEIWNTGTVDDLLAAVDQRLT